MLAYSAVVTGCNRGIGLTFVSSLATQVQQVIAICRNPGNAVELKDLAEKHKNITILQQDVTQFEELNKMADQVAAIVGDGGLTLLINNAAINNARVGVDLVTAENMIESFTVNSVAPLMVTKALLPVLKIAANHSSQNGYTVKHPTVVNITSVLGSITRNDGERGGGIYPYRCSKSALNMVTRSLGHDLKPYNITAVCIHPGWVRTDMGGPKAHLLPSESVEKMIEVIRQLDISRTGEFLNFDGESIPW